MRRLIMALSVAVSCAFVPAVPVAADGLIYKLPDDGATVTYDMQIKVGPDGSQRDLAGTLRVSSVGVETVGDEKCRWIEFKIDFEVDGAARLIVCKALIPERHLEKGKSPGDNMLRGWLKFPELDVMEVKDLKGVLAGPLAAFLAGPPASPMKLEPVAVENARLGKQECAGEIAAYEFQQGENTVETTWEHRFSDQAPFGVLATRLKFATKVGGAVVQSGEAVFTLTDVGTTALTELPNNR